MTILTVFKPDGATKDEHGIEHVTRIQISPPADTRRVTHALRELAKVSDTGLVFYRYLPDRFMELWVEYEA